MTADDDMKHSTGRSSTGGLTGGVSSHDLLQRTSNDVASCSVDDWICRYPHLTRHLSLLSYSSGSEYLTVGREVGANSSSTSIMGSWNEDTSLTDSALDDLRSTGELSG